MSAKTLELQAKVQLPILKVIILKDEDRYCAKCPQVDLVTEMDTPEEAFNSLLEMIREYTDDYLKRKNAFLKSPNRFHHYPYVLQIAKCKNEWELRELIEVRYGSLHL